jgi:hypothetical protein
MRNNKMRRGTSTRFSPPGGEDRLLEEPGEARAGPSDHQDL